MELALLVLVVGALGAPVYFWALALKDRLGRTNELLEEIRNELRERR